jgi:hypothetical protein
MRKVISKFRCAISRNRHNEAPRCSPRQPLVANNNILVSDLLHKCSFGSVLSFNDANLNPDVTFLSTNGDMGPVKRK